MLYATIVVQQTRLGWSCLILPDDLFFMWQLFCFKLPSVFSLKIPRHIDITCYNNIKLLGFADAFIKGYAATVYLCIVNSTGYISVSHHIKQRSLRWWVLQSINYYRYHVWNCATLYYWHGRFNIRIKFCRQTYPYHGSKLGQAPQLYCFSWHHIKNI